MSTYFSRNDKPEGALKRAQDLISVGNKPDALKLLHDVITAKRHHRQWQSTYENIMMMYLELCVDLKEHRGAKDGLHQYRNMSQAHGGDSLEKVINFYVELADRKADEAKKKAVAAADAVKSIDNLESDCVPDPESIMLSTMTEDSDKERNDRDIMVPWLKFQWETYRAVLEVLRTMQKLEKVYHLTCHRALEFCKTNLRNREFHSLCETLSNHLGNLLKATSSIGPSGKEHKPKGWDQWTGESIELHLQTRFKQLEVSDALKLWNEGFRIVEDIYTLMQIPVRQSDGSLNRKQQKPRLMATYYDKLTKIFYVSENYLFHAYAWHKYYMLTKEAKSFSAEEKAVQASTVLLAALCVPSNTDTTQSSDALLNEDILKRKKKNEKIAALLEFNANPTRSLLLSEIVSKGIVNQVLPELKDVYQRLEVDFAPLQLISSMLPTLAFLRKHPKLRIYVPHLERLLVIRLFKQLAGVYHTVKMGHLKRLLSGLEIDFHDVEQLIVAAVKERQVKVRVDHLGQCLHFGEAELEGDSMRYQLQSLASQLSTVSQVLAPPDVSQREAQRSDFFRMVLANLEAQHLATLARKEAIEKQKVDKERERQRKREAEQNRKAEEEKKRRANEEKRMEEEKRKREEEQKKKDEEALALESVQSKLKDMGLASKVEDIRQLNAEARKKELEDLVAAQQQAKKDEAKKMAEQAKRLDYAVRALRLHEKDLIQEAYTAQMAKVQADHDTKEKEVDAQRKAAFDNNLNLKKLFAPMLAYTKAFEEGVNKVRRAEFEAHVARLRSEYERAQQQKILRAKKRKEDKEARETRQNREMEQIRAFEAERLRARQLEREQYEKEVADRMAGGRGVAEEEDYGEEEDYVGEEDEEIYGPGHPLYKKGKAAGIIGAANGHPEGEERGGDEEEQPLQQQGGPRKYVPPSKRGESGGQPSWRDREAAKMREKEEHEAKRKQLLRERGSSGDIPPPPPPEEEAASGPPVPPPAPSSEGGSSWRTRHNATSERGGGGFGSGSRGGDRESSFERRGGDKESFERRGAGDLERDSFDRKPFSRGSYEGGDRGGGYGGERRASGGYGGGHDRDGEGGPPRRRYDGRERGGGGGDRYGGDDLGDRPPMRRGGGGGGRYGGGGGADNADNWRRGSPAPASAGDEGAN